MTTNTNSSIKILVVDDKPDLLLIAERLLKKENYSVTTATSGQGCLDAVNLNKPDLLLLDVMLPDINGVDICKIIKSNPNLASIYIFLISGFAIKSESISEGLELGADGYLIKPIKSRELLARIEAAVRIIRTEKALRESEDKFRNIFDYSVVGKSMTMMDGTLKTNKAFRDILGYSEDELSKIHWQEITHIDDIETDTKVINSIISFEKPNVRWEKRYIHKNGNIVWVDISTTLLRDNKGVPLHFITSIIDITERKLADISLRESQQMLKTVLDNFPGVVFWKDRQSNYLGSNLSFAKGAGLNTSEEIIGKNDFDLPWAKTEAENYRTDDLIVMQSGQEKLHIIEMQHQINGKVIWLDTSKIPIVNSEGTVIGVIGVSSDITERKLVEIALKEREEEFHSLAESMPQIVWSTRADGWNIYFNQQWVDYTGLTLEESYGAGWNKPFHPDDQQRAWDAWQNAVNNNGTYSIEVRLRRFDGEYRWWLIRGVPKIGENDEILKWFGTCTDIEDIKKTQDELRETNEYLENLFNYANAPIIVWDTDFRITQFNNAFEKLSGLNASDVIGKKIDILFPKDKIDYSYELINKTAIGEKWETVEIEILRQNGEVRIVLWNSANILDATQSQIVATIAQGHDITERKKAEEALIESDRLLRESQKIAALGSYRWDLLTGFWESSEILDDIFGIDAAYERSLKGWTDIIHPDWQEVISNYLLNEVVSKNQRFDKEYQIVRQNDGQKHWVHGLGKLELDTNNKPLKLVGTILDITERKLIENELKKSEINFRRSISESPLGIRIVTVDGNTIYANKSFLDIYDFDSLEEYTSTPAINRYTPESYTLHQERKKKRRDEVEVFDYEISINCKNGDIRHIKVSRKEILWNGNKHFQVINQDITEQRKAEEELRKLSIAVEQSPNAECITDTNGIIEYVNPITIKLTGYVKEELIGRKTSIFRSGKTPKQEYVELWETIKSGNVWKGELHNKKKNGELYWESTTISPIFNNQGEITHFMAIKVDITERKRIELELNKSEEQLHRFASHLQNVREEEKIAIAREIHDDLGQLLVALKIDTGLLKKNVIKTISESDTSEIEFRFDNLVTQINNSIKTARNIMNGLRPELLEMHGIVGALKEYLREFQERHGIDCEFDCDIVNLDMNPKQSLAIFRILQEALNNIVKHANATLVRIQLQISDNKLVLQITDNGVGFDKNNSGREDSYGMIGMKERVILLDGELDIISEIGHGTTVRVEIPYQK